MKASDYTIAKEFFYAIGNAGNQTIGGGVILPLNNVVFPSPSFSVAGGVITYSGPSKVFMVQFKFSGDVPNNVRSNAETFLRQNGVAIADSRVVTYHRMLADGDGTGSDERPVRLGTGNTLDVFSADITAADTTFAITPECTILIKEWR